MSENFRPKGRFFAEGRAGKAILKNLFFWPKISLKKTSKTPKFSNALYYSGNIFRQASAQARVGSELAIGSDIPKVGELTKSQQGWLLENYSIGDYRVYWECLGEEGDTVSVLGEITSRKPDSSSYPETDDHQQILEKFSTSENSPAIALLEKGEYPKTKLINRAFRKHKRTSWWWRILLTILLMAGVVLLWEIVLGIFEQVYFLRNMMRGRAGVVVFAGFIAITISMIVISSCWMEVQPVLAWAGVLASIFPWLSIFVKFRSGRR